MFGGTGLYPTDFGAQRNGGGPNKGRRVTVAELGSEPWAEGQELSASGGRWGAKDFAAGGGRYRIVAHYDTAMLEWLADSTVVSYYNLGHGSVSDQDGVNKIARAAGLPIRYYRDTRGGGPRITVLD